MVLCKFIEIKGILLFNGIVNSRREIAIYKSGWILFNNTIDIEVFVAGYQLRQSVSNPQEMETLKLKIYQTKFPIVN